VGKFFSLWFGVTLTVQGDTRPPPPLYGCVEPGFGDRAYSGFCRVLPRVPPVAVLVFPLCHSRFVAFLVLRNVGSPQHFPPFRGFGSCDLFRWVVFFFAGVVESRFFFFTPGSVGLFFPREPVRSPFFLILPTFHPALWLVLPRAFCPLCFFSGFPPVTHLSPLLCL